MKPRISTLITDVDNTLFDWVEMWYRAFDALLSQLAVESGVDRAILEAETRQAFIQHGTSEYGLLLYELPSICARCAPSDISQTYRSSIAAFRAAYGASLSLYPTVLSTLRTLRISGCRTVAYTESLPLYAIPRMKRLGLDGLIDYLYCPPDEDVTAKTFANLLQKLDRRELTLEYTARREVPSRRHKPDPEVLKSILRDVGAHRDQTVYVGDNLMKDIDMAQRAGVRDVYAEYGAIRTSSKYALLQRMSHWTDEDVRRERQFYEQGHMPPAYVLTRTFNEMLEYFVFGPHTPFRAR